MESLFHQKFSFLPILLARRNLSVYQRHKQNPEAPQRLVAVPPTHTSKRRTAAFPMKIYMGIPFHWSSHSHNVSRSTRYTIELWTGSCRVTYGFARPFGTIQATASSSWSGLKISKPLSRFRQVCSGLVPEGLHQNIGR
jgi:hypothetical protein